MNKCKLTLRALEPEDVEFIAQMENDEDSLRYSDRVAPLSLQSVRTYIMTCDPDPFATGQLRLMVESDDGERVGLLDFYEITQRHSHAMVGLIIAPVHRGKGLSVRILRMACLFSERRLHLESLGALVAAGNIPSLRAFERAGFREVGRLSNWWHTIDGRDDCVMMQIDCNNR